MQAYVGIGLVLVVVIAVFTVLAGSFPKSNITGNVLDQTSDQGTQQNEGQAVAATLPRFVFYKTLRVSPNPAYADTCYPQSEVMIVVPNNNCCEGLDTLGVIDESQEDCQFVTGIAFCSDCGNGKCEYGENNCNCPEDCNAVVK